MAVNIVRADFVVNNRAALTQAGNKENWFQNNGTNCLLRHECSLSIAYIKH